MGSLVRRVEVKDYVHVFLLNKEFNPQLEQYSETRVKEKLETIIRKDIDRVFVYEQDNEVLGYIHGSPYELLFSESLINVLGFVVSESHRNQGIGSSLISHLEEWGRNHGYSGMKLLTHPSRIQAHKFYEKRGYLFTKDQKNYIKEFKV
ncbi:GNAT family N-acetyltransferase [Paenibacillus kobensis]|uniref:GNAT family N-acetyltransferase n=1 Tax=Paenibacillus kobensis TaxID=59841 RepID=UPI000FDA8EAC|nr:GNAT family N-acetyltransferase [Paenibacillus kobensis]